MPVSHSKLGESNNKPLIANFRLARRSLCLRRDRGRGRLERDHRFSPTMRSHHLATPTEIPI